MTSPDMTATLAQIEAARAQAQANIALVQTQLSQAQDAAEAASLDRAAAEAAVQQSITVDTSVGTRVYAGDTMIHGDTGWRNVTGLRKPGLLGDLLVRRIGDVIHMKILGVGVTVETVNYVDLFDLPSGFNAHERTTFPMTHSFTLARRPILWVENNKVRISTEADNDKARYTLAPGDTYRAVGSWVSKFGWPTALPGVQG